MSMRYGVVLFDDAFKKSGSVGDRKRTTTEGWAAIEGESARRILSTGELQSDVKWCTNFDFTDFNQHFLGRNPNMYFSGFLRTELKTISQEIAASADYLAADAAAQNLAVLFGRIMRLAVSELGLDVEAAAPLGIKTLSDLLIGKVKTKHRMQPEISQALGHGYQTWTTVTKSLRPNWKSATLRKPRYLHAIDVLSNPVPSEHRWVYVNDARLPTQSAERIDWCIGHEYPVLANVVVKPKRGDYTNIVNYNSGASLTRSWVSQPELLFLSQFCEIDVVGAFVCEGGFEHQKELEKFPSLGDFSLASYSLGLLAENFWVALASPRTILAKKVYPPRAIWYRSYDRIAMFMYAAKLNDAGFQITGYGTGSVLLCYPAGATDEMIAAANELGLDVPLSKYAELRNETRLVADE